MATFTTHTLDTAPEGAVARLTDVQNAWGFLPKLHSKLAESPLALEAYDTLFGMVASRSSLSAIEQQVAYQTVNVFHECEYCAAGHTYLSRMAKMDEGVIHSLREGKPIDNARLEALRSFVLAVVEKRGQVEPSITDEFLAQGYTKAQVLEVLVIIATKTISNYANRITETEQEAFMADPSLRWVAPRHRATAA
jgi:AhpD family alkylhydroperoxidase